MAGGSTARWRILAASAIAIVGTFLGVLYRGMAIENRPFDTAANNALMGAGLIFALIVIVALVARFGKRP